MLKFTFTLLLSNFLAAETFGNEKTWSGPFFFIQGTDTQFGMIHGLKGKPGHSWEEEIRLTRALIAKINQMDPKPKFFVVCGDLCDAFPLENEALRTAQMKDFVKVMTELNSDIPLELVCGNHDVENTPTESSINAYKSSFGDDFYSFWVGGVMFIVLNSQLYYDPSQTADLAKKQNDWLEAQLKIGASSKHGPVIFQHIPWFLESVNSTSDKYFAIPYATRIPMIEKLYNAGVKYIFAGHYHRNLISKYKEMEMVVTSAIGGQLGDDQSGFRVVSVNDDNITHKYYAIEDSPPKLT